MCSRLVRLGLFITIFCGAALSPAQARDDYARKGFHVGALAVIAFPLWEGQLQEESLPITDLSLGISGGFDLRGGYRFSERVAAEMGFEWIAAHRFEVAGVQVSEAANWMYYVDMKIFVLTGRTQPFVLLGMGAYHLDYLLPTVGGRDWTVFAPRVGGGLEYYFTEQVALTTEVNYVLATSKLNGRDRVALSIGLFYRF
jgi:opacity protein-like surface antigen